MAARRTIKSTLNPFASSDEESGDDNNKLSGGGNNNPFGSSKSSDESSAAAAAAPGAGAGAASSSANPFDFDVDFSQVQKRRERARAAKKMKEQQQREAKAAAAHLEDDDDDEEDEEAARQPIMQGMDAYVEPLVSNSNSNNMTASGDTFGGGMGTAIGTSGQSQRRPNVIIQSNRSKTTGDISGSGGLGGGGGGFNQGLSSSATGTAGATQNRTMSLLAKNFAGLANQAAAMSGKTAAASASTASASAANNNNNNNASYMEQDAQEERECFLQIGNRRLVIFPYDDYHLVQKTYYERMDDTTPKPFDKNNKNKNQRQQQDNNNSNNAMVDNSSTTSSIPIFQRPADPPDIPTAVQGLSLTEFERVAEQRSIAIVSTWLFDAGLIDELLVNGGMTTGTNLLMGGGQHNSSSENRSVGSGGEGSSAATPLNEGIEIGSHGFPIEGATKMDKEIAKLRNSTKRQLALINARLNDGVAATGSEVQELVNLVIATKDDIGRLRELSTYVSNTASVDETNQFMLTKYPKLKQAINARRNLGRCFRELDFFSQIPSTCDRLREELHAGEWTAHEWSTLRSVCREHVELEIFLVEAEAGMKKRLQEEEEEQQQQQNSSAPAGGRGGRVKRGKSSFDMLAIKNVGLSQRKNELIDRFLSEHVENVWELGDEIRLRIMSGIATAFDLAMNNPGGMVALVEAVESYESANQEYKAVHGVEAGNVESVGDGQTLRFTDMRAAALGELYKDIESRGLTVFHELINQAADVAEEEEAANQQFSAVLRAANGLTSEIMAVKEQMAPCFPPNWAIETLWTTCVAHVCSTNILQQIGGQDGHKLPDLTVTQLLDLVAWVETFREVIEEAFPNIASIASKRTYLEKPPKLLAENSKTVDLDAAKDSLAWVNNTLWDVHDLAKDEFLFRTKEQTEEWLDNVYDADHTKTQTAEGRLVTSLCEDVYSLAGVQLRTIRERLTRRSEALVQAVGVIFKNLYEKQMSARDDFCNDLEECCAASNDFVRMSEKCEEIVGEIQEECNLSPEATETLEEQSAALLGLYSGDAVYAAQKTHIYCFEPIEEAIAEELFGADWQDQLTHNELALTLVRTLDDFMEDLETFLDEVMVQKTVEAQITASVNFYLKILMTKSANHKSGMAGATAYFSNVEKAIGRMRGDLETIREYFVGLTDSMPTLKRVIEREFAILEAVIEILSIAAGLSHSDVQDFILMLQKSIRNVAITKLVVGDLYHLVKPADEHKVYELVNNMEAEMLAVAPNDENAASSARDRMTVPGLRLDQTMAKICMDESTRKRPTGAAMTERAENALRGWRTAISGAKKISS